MVAIPNVSKHQDLHQAHIDLHAHIQTIRARRHSTNATRAAAAAAAAAAPAAALSTW